MAGRGVSGDQPVSADSADPVASDVVLACGSRNWNDYEVVLEHLASLLDSATICHGGAEGADRHVSAACAELGLDCYVFPARYDKHGRAAPHVRNDQMLAQASRVIAFWDGKSRGTKSVIEKARKLGLRVEVIVA
jgi:YspA, cpYpsA-related SLOG family